MDNEAKVEVIREWIDPDERVTIDFLDEKGVTSVITGCTTEHVDLLLETHFVHLKQHVCVPMSKVVVGEDPTHYTRDPEKPLHYGRLRLIILQNRPQSA